MRVLNRILIASAALVAGCNVYGPDLLDEIGSAGSGNQAGKAGSAGTATGGTSGTGNPEGGSAGNTPNGGNGSAGTGVAGEGNAGGGTGGTSAGGSGGFGGTNLPDPNVISDFEDSTPQSIYASEGRAGFWYTYADPEPKPAMAFDTPEGAEVTPKRAIHITSPALTVASGFGVDLNNKKAYDASKYEGVRFYLKVGATNATSIRFTISDFYTFPHTGGPCDKSDTAPLGTRCYDDWTFDVEIDAVNTWQLYTVIFDGGMTVEGWGLHKDPLGLDETRMFQMQFKFEANKVVDVWVDDVEFF